MIGFFLNLWYVNAVAASRSVGKAVMYEPQSERLDSRFLQATSWGVLRQDAKTPQ